LLGTEGRREFFETSQALTSLSKDGQRLQDELDTIELVAHDSDLFEFQRETYIKAKFEKEKKSNFSNKKPAKKSVVKNRTKSK
jgi:hypothetical protein